MHRSCKWTVRDTERENERASERQTGNRIDFITVTFLKDSIHYIPLIYNKHTLIQL